MAPGDSLSQSTSPGQQDRSAERITQAGRLSDMRNKVSHDLLSLLPARRKVAVQETDPKNETCVYDDPSPILRCFGLQGASGFLSRWSKIYWYVTFAIAGGMLGPR